MKVAIFGNTQKALIREEVDHLLGFLARRKVEVVLSEEIRQEFNLRDYAQFDPQSIKEAGDENRIDFALSIGGDGTFLTTTSQVVETDIPILGINYGHLGFLSEVETKDVDTILNQLLKGQYMIEQRSLLSISCSTGGNIASPYALNEIAIMKYGLNSMISIEVCVNGEYLCQYEGDGLIVATPTGSTAYNLSVGGPIMVPQARGILLSPVASHSLNFRPLVVPDDWKIDLKIKSRTGSYMVSIDGRSQVISDEVTLCIEKSSHTVKLVQVGNHSFLKALKDKLLWGKEN